MTSSPPGLQIPYRLIDSLQISPKTCAVESNANANPSPTSRNSLVPPDPPPPHQEERNSEQPLEKSHLPHQQNTKIFPLPLCDEQSERGYWNLPNSYLISTLPPRSTWVSYTRFPKDPSFLSLRIISQMLERRKSERRIKLMYRSITQTSRNLQQGFRGKDKVVC